MVRPELKSLLNAVVATNATPPAINIAGARKVTLLLSRANHTSGSSAFTVEVSHDNITFVPFNMLIDNVTNTNAQNPTRVASVTLASNTSKFYALDISNFNFQFLRTPVVITTDGNASALALVDNDA